MTLEEALKYAHEVKPPMSDAMEACRVLAAEVCRLKRGADALLLELNEVSKHKYG